MRFANHYRLQDDEHIVVQVHLTVGELRELAAVGHALGVHGDLAAAATAAIDQLVARVGDGVSRPGSWERNWLESVAPDLDKVLEPDDSQPGVTWRQRPATPRCACGRLAERNGSCWDCLDDEDQARERALRAGRDLPAWMHGDERTGCWSPSPEVDALTTEAIEARAAVGRERHRRCRRLRGGGCRGSAPWSAPDGVFEHDREFACVVCRRWRCWCRGGCPDSVPTMRSACDECEEAYHFRRKSAARSLCEALVRQRDRQIGRLAGAAISEERVGAAFREVVNGLRWSDRAWAVDGQGRPLTACEFRRMVRLGWRVLSRSGAGGRLGLVVWAWAWRSGLGSPYVAAVRDRFGSLQAAVLSSTDRCGHLRWFARSLEMSCDLAAEAATVPAFAFLTATP